MFATTKTVLWAAPAILLLAISYVSLFKDRLASAPKKAQEDTELVHDSNASKVEALQLKMESISELLEHRLTFAEVLARFWVIYEESYDADNEHGDSVAEDLGLEQKLVNQIRNYLNGLNKIEAGSLAARIHEIEQEIAIYQEDHYQPPVEVIEKVKKKKLKNHIRVH